MWTEIEYALEKIVDDYEKVNHIISLFQDDRNRLRSLRIIRSSLGTGLELGSGPGNYSRMIASVHNGPLVCLDFSIKMLRASKARNHEFCLNYVRAVFEALPFRGKVFSLVMAAYALRDSTDEPRAFSEANLVMSAGGRFLLIDIGKPNNPIVRGLLGLYLRFVVPIISGLISGYGYKNPWSLLYKTYCLLPKNQNMKRLLLKHLEKVEVHSSVLGAMIMIVGKKRTCK